MSEAKASTNLIPQNRFSAGLLAAIIWYLVFVLGLAFVHWEWDLLGHYSLLQFSRWEESERMFFLASLTLIQVSLYLKK